MDSMIVIEAGEGEHMTIVNGKRGTRVKSRRLAWNRDRGAKFRRRLT
jgi:hypothetical protein